MFNINIMSFLEWRDYFFQEYRVESCKNDIITEAVINESYIIKVENGENFSFRQKFVEDTISNSSIKKEAESCIEDKLDMENITRSLLQLNNLSDNSFSLDFNRIKSNFDEGLIIKSAYNSNKETNINLIDEISDSSSYFINNPQIVLKQPETTQDNTYNFPLKSENKPEFKKKDITIEIDKHNNFKNETQKIIQEVNSKSKKEHIKDFKEKINNDYDMFSEMKNSFNLKEDDIDDIIKKTRKFKTKTIIPNKDNNILSNKINENKVDDTISHKESEKDNTVVPVDSFSHKNSNKENEVKSTNYSNFIMNETLSTDTKGKEESPKIESNDEKKLSQPEKENKKEDSIQPMMSNENKSSEIQNNIEYKLENFISNDVLSNFFEMQNRKKSKNEILEKELTEKVNNLKQQNKIVSDENKKLLEILHLYKIIQNIENNEPPSQSNVEKDLMINKPSKLKNRLKIHSEIENPVKAEQESKIYNHPLNNVIIEPISKQNIIADNKGKKKESNFICSNTTGKINKNKQINTKNKFKQFIDLKLISTESSTKSYKEIYRNQVRVKSPEREMINENESRKSNAMSPVQKTGTNKGKIFINPSKINNKFAQSSTSYPNNNGKLH